MTLSHGMNVDEVRALGVKLQNHYSATIEQLMNEMNGLVDQTSSSWVGPDAENFRSWWPEKKAALQAIATDLHGFGQSAINNATEQTEVSSR